MEEFDNWNLNPFSQDFVDTNVISTEYLDDLNTPIPIPIPIRNVNKHTKKKKKKAKNNTHFPLSHFQRNISEGDFLMQRISHDKEMWQFHKQFWKQCQNFSPKEVPEWVQDKCALERAEALVKVREDSKKKREKIIEQSIIKKIQEQSNEFGKPDAHFKLEIRPLRHMSQTNQLSDLYSTIFPQKLTSNPYKYELKVTTSSPTNSIGVHITNNKLLITIYRDEKHSIFKAAKKLYVHIMVIQMSFKKAYEYDRKSTLQFFSMEEQFLYETNVFELYSRKQKVEKEFFNLMLNMKQPFVQGNVRMIGMENKMEKKKIKKNSYVRTNKKPMQKIGGKRKVRMFNCGYENPNKFRKIE